MADAPDYTLLSDVNVVGSVTLDVNVVGSVTINTNITGVESGVTFDVNITHSDITFDVKITEATVTLNVNITNEVLQSKLVKSALMLNGENAYVEIPLTSELDLHGQPHTVLAFAKIVSYPREWIPVTPIQAYGYGLFYNSSGLYLRAHAIQDSTLKMLDYSWTDDREKHLFGQIYDGTDLHIVLDGVIVASGVTSTTSVTQTNNNVLVGRAWNPSDQWMLNGVVYQVLIYNRVLSSEELEYIYDNPQSPPVNGLVLWLNFDEGRGTVAYDKSSYGNDGTIHNAIWVSESGKWTPLIDVNLTASQITLNINITAQDIDVKIYTPSGRWVSSSDLLTSTTSYVATNISSGAEQTVLTLSGRGRLKSIGFYFARTDPNGDVYTQTRIRVYIDGETDPSVNVSPADIDDFMGRLLLRQLQFDYETVVPATGTKAAFAQVTSPVCGLTNIWYDEDSQKYKVSGGFLVLNTEFLSSAEVKIYNGSDGPIEARMLIFYGEYV